MGKDRRRINLSIDVDTYRELQLAQRAYGFRNTCEIVTSLVRVFVDRQRAKDMQVYDLSESDAEYIDGMFSSLSDVEPQPVGEVPVRHNNKSLNDYGER